MTVPGIGGAVAWSAKGVFVTQGLKGTGIIDIRDADTGSTSSLRLRDTTAMSPTWRSARTVPRWPPPGKTGCSDRGSRDGSIISSKSDLGSVADPSFSGDGALVAAVWDFRTTRIMDIATGDVVRSFRLSHYSAKDSADYPVVDASLSADGGGSPWSTTRGRRDHGHRDRPRSGQARRPQARPRAGLEPRRSIHRHGGASGAIEIWNARTGEIQHELWGQRSYVWAVAWSPDGSRIVTGGGEGAAQVWEVGTAESREIMSLTSQETTGGITDVTFSPDGSRWPAPAARQARAIVRSKVWDVGRGGDAELANLPAPRAFGDAAFVLDLNHVAVTTAGARCDLGLDPPANSERPGPLGTTGTLDRGTPRSR